MVAHPSMRSLLAFEAAARHSSVLRAAEELNVTPGAVSRQVQALERLLGVELFRRGHRQLTLTRPGEEFLALVRPPLQGIGAAIRRVRRARDRATVSVCAYPTFAIRWFIPRWSRFYDRHPGIDVRLTTSLSPVAFEQDGYDMAIQVMGDGGPAPAFAAHRLVDVETTPVCTPQMAAQLRDPADLRSVVLIHSDPRPQDWPRWLESVGAPAVDAGRGPRFESLNLAFQAAIEGLGVAMGIASLVEADVAEGRLALPFPALSRVGKPMRLVYPADRLRHEPVRIFRDWLLAEAGREVPA